MDSSSQKNDRESMASVGALAIDWAAAARERWKAIGLLGLAEARLAAMGMAAMVFCAAAAALLAVTAWAAFNALVAVALNQAGLSLIAILTGMSAAHAGLAWLVWLKTLRLTRHIEFPVTRELLRSSSSDGSSTTAGADDRHPDVRH